MTFTVETNELSMQVFLLLQMQLIAVELLTRLNANKFWCKSFLWRVHTFCLEIKIISCIFVETAVTSPSATSGIANHSLSRDWHPSGKYRMVLLLLNMSCIYLDVNVQQ